MQDHIESIRLNRAFNYKWKINEDDSYGCAHMKIDSSDGDRKLKLLPAMLGRNYKLISYNLPNISKDI